jgi:hypothetical protein
MTDPLPVPIAFDPEREPLPFLARVKKKAATKFRMSSNGCRHNAATLAYWLLVFHREQEADEVCRFLGTVEFTGNFSQWSSIEAALTLQARLARVGGRPAEAAECVKRIVTAGYASSRLTGGLLAGRGGRRECIQEAVARKDKTAEREWRLLALTELCFMIELGGSKRYPVEALEEEFRQNLDALRVLLKVPVPA